ncbi:MAG: SDR family NAD(P)-dependent oxidoreductase [Sulfurimonas sp.]|uniref:SDR family NAD(P)-dependent oxidoreductase n=1 Tax=Sulfurimonas sp. TaxID=2022749 RepID=UPI0025E515AE|nr:SDR family NAD(P)-dependent oxidoreductase [Sulfurimonas sp.]MCK9492468.1 SDR family NAD(P)-dependent oxidoreductase [Sulfurimonas sp.]
MKNKIVLITGANGGLGRIFVEKILKSNPKKIYCSARDLSSLQKIKELSDIVEVIELDIASKESIDKAVAKIDKLDILINNAGVNSNTKIFDDSFIDLEVNLKGTSNLTKALFEKLKSSKGMVVNVTSVLALVNLPALGSYCVSKSALHSHTQALRAEFGLFGGEVYEVLPGPIDTKMTEGSAMPKTSPQDIVDATLNAIKNKVYEIYPDGFAQMIRQRLQDEPEKVIEEFAMSIQG